MRESATLAAPLAHRNDAPARRCFQRMAVGCPISHEPAPLLKQIAASVRGLYLVVHRMGERHFYNVIRVVRLLRGPVAEHETTLPTRLQARSSLPPTEGMR
jgi:hypothetical protein